MLVLNVFACAMSSEDRWEYFNLTTDIPIPDYEFSVFSYSTNTLSKSIYVSSVKVNNG